MVFLGLQGALEPSDLKQYFTLIVWCVSTSCLSRCCDMVDNVLEPHD
jgi:hypothetical protein